MINDSFWKARRVFVTGHTGFKGSWLWLWLQLLESKVTGYALPPDTQPSLFQTFTKPDRKYGDAATQSNSVIGDIRDAVRLRQALQDCQPEVVFHLAAQAQVRKSYREPAETYSTNVMGTVNLLEAVRHCAGVKAVVVVTSDKCYSNREWVWGYRETDSMGGYDPYSSSKGCAELVAGAWRSSYFNEQQYAKHGVALATARAGNVIGGGDWSEDRLVPDLLRAFAEGTSAELRNPLALRPWQHVLEPLHGYLMLAERLHDQGMPWAQAWNFGPADADTQTVGWIASQLARLWGEGARWHTGTPREQWHEAQHLKLDCSKAHKVLGWQPQLSLFEALRAIVQWHQSHQENGDVRTLSSMQITRHQTSTQKSAVPA